VSRGWDRDTLAVAAHILADPGRTVRLVEAWAGPDDLLTAKAEEMTSTLGIDPARGAELCGAIRDGGQDESSRLERVGIGTLSIFDPGYPRLLRQTPKAPPLLYVRGDVRALASRGLAIVGTRKATAYGRAVAEAVAAMAVQAGLSVVSGGALGIDTVAHSAACREGTTVVVLGCGLDWCYPPSNRGLFGRVIDEGGCLISEFCPGTRPRAHHFPQRNRVIAGLAECVVVVEAPAKSGALITAGYAADLGREVIAVPGQVWAPQSAGCLGLIRDGATPLTDPADVLAAFGLEEALRAPAALSDGQRRVLEHIQRGADDLDALVAVSGLDAPACLASIAELEIAGHVRRDEGGRLVAVQVVPAGARSGMM
jgi:DNA processing protein